MMGNRQKRKKSIITIRRDIACRYAHVFFSFMSQFLFLLFFSSQREGWCGAVSSRSTCVIHTYMAEYLARYLPFLCVFLLLIVCVCMCLCKRKLRSRISLDLTTCNFRSCTTKIASPPPASGLFSFSLTHTHISPRRRQSNASTHSVLVTRSRIAPGVINFHGISIGTLCSRSRHHTGGEYISSAQVHRVTSPPHVEAAGKSRIDSIDVVVVVVSVSEHFPGRHLWTAGRWQVELDRGIGS